MPEWVYDDRSTRYRDLSTGRYVGAEQVREWAGEAMRASSDSMGSLASMVSDGRLTVGDWQGQMRGAIKETYIQQYVSGRGGIEQMTQRDWGSIGGMVREQYRYLDGFAAQVATGELSEGQIGARSRMYIESGREAHERGYERAAQEAGLNEVLWVIDAAAENCNDCLGFAGLSWQRVEDDPYGGAKPGTGDTECLTNCRCHLEYRRAEE